MAEVDGIYLAPTAIIDSDHEQVIRYAKEATAQSKDPIEKAVQIYYAVRDGIYYDPYYTFYLPEHYRASNVLRSGRGYCVSKASLLCALGRACEIPSRVGFATDKTAHRVSGLRSICLSRVHRILSGGQMGESHARFQ
jgi:transglutaminase-like putative cysteine protease